MARLTLAFSIPLFMPSIAEAVANGYQPFTICPAVHFWHVLLLGVVDTGAADFHQRRRISPCDGVWKLGQIAHRERTLLIEHADGHQGDAGAHILKRQVKPLFAQWPYISDLSVQLHDPVADVHLGEALISGDGVDLGKLALSDETLFVAVRFIVVQVKRLLASPHDARKTIAVPQGELDLNVHPLSPFSGDPVSSEPVILAGFHHVAHLVGSDGCIFFIHNTHFLPLQRSEENGSITTFHHTGICQPYFTLIQLQLLLLFSSNKTTEHQSSRIKPVMEKIRQYFIAGVVLLF